MLARLLNRQARPVRYAIDPALMDAARNLLGVRLRAGRYHDLLDPINRWGDMAHHMEGQGFPLGGLADLLEGHDPGDLLMVHDRLNDAGLLNLPSNHLLHNYVRGIDEMAGHLGPVLAGNQPHAGLVGGYGSPALRGPDHTARVMDWMENGGMHPPRAGLSTLIGHLERARNPAGPAMRASWHDLDQRGDPFALMRIFDLATRILRRGADAPTENRAAAVIGHAAPGLSMIDRGARDVLQGLPAPQRAL